MDPFTFQVGARYDIEYVGHNLTLASLNGALVVGTRSGPKGNEYEFRRENGRFDSSSPGPDPQSRVGRG